MPAHTRRLFLLQSACALACAAAAAPVSARAAAVAQIAALEAHLGGRIGLAAIDTGGGARISYRGNERFALCSTFKWILAAAVLAREDHDAGILGQPLPYGAADLLPHSPVTAAHVAEGSLSVMELTQATVETSDNAAANLLLTFLGGPAALTQYLRSIGDRTTRLDRTETSLNDNLPGDPRDTTTPDAMLATMQAVLLGNALSSASREMLLTWLKDCQTGLARLRAGLPHAWTAGDKTGTGENGAANDVAIAWPPQRPPILIAAYLSESHAAAEALDAVHARLGGIVAAAFS
jgi:beta-lactamase class A